MFAPSGLTSAAAVLFTQAAITTAIKEYQWPVVSTMITNKVPRTQTDHFSRTMSVKTDQSLGSNEAETSQRWRDARLGNDSGNRFSICI